VVSRMGGATAWWDKKKNDNIVIFEDGLGKQRHDPAVARVSARARSEPVQARTFIYFDL